MSRQDHWKLSASWISSFKACTKRCYYSYIKHIRPAEQTDALRMGSNWHTMLEVYSRNNSMDEAIDALDAAYESKPLSKTVEEWAVERAKLAYSLSGYIWYNDDLEVVAREIPFSIKIINPETGTTLPDCEVVGVIDKLIKINEQIAIGEHKSTSDSVDNDSKLWGHLRLDTQTTLYQYAANQLSMSGALEEFGIPKGTLITGGLYDVWHKPGISPKKLTQGDSKKFVVMPEYMGQKFEITSKDNDINSMLVNGVSTEVEPGKKEGTYTIRETAEMYGARLLFDIQERPEFYFNRKPLPRSINDMKRFERELYGIYKTARYMDKHDAWFCNEQQCEAKFHCQYIPICYNNVDVDKYLPEGFIRREKKND